MLSIEFHSPKRAFAIRQFSDKQESAIDRTVSSESRPSCLSRVDCMALDLVLARACCLIPKASVITWRLISSLLGRKLASIKALRSQVVIHFKWSSFLKPGLSRLFEVYYTRNSGYLSLMSQLHRLRRLHMAAG